MKIGALFRRIVVTFCIVLLSSVAYYGSFFNHFFSCIAYPIIKLNALMVEPTKSWLFPQHDISDRDTLKRQNQLLHMQNIRLRGALAYAQHIKELYEFNKRYHERGHIAQVIARNFSDTSHHFLLDAGLQKGIAKDMVVIYKNNLIGKIVEVYPWYSKVCLVTDRNCKIAAFCTQTHAQGIHEGLNDQCKTSLNFVNHLAEVNERDLIVSSGEGLVFPEGFALGRIAAFTNDGLYKTITVQPLCNLREIDYCVVMAKR